MEARRRRQPGFVQGRLEVADDIARLERCPDGRREDEPVLAPATASRDPVRVKPPPVLAERLGEDRRERECAAAAPGLGRDQLLASFTPPQGDGDPQRALCWPLSPSATRSWHSGVQTARKPRRMEQTASTAIATALQLMFFGASVDEVLDALPEGHARIGYEIQALLTAEQAERSMASESA
jgi:hypothetical protein